jgi:O-antigen ligase
MTIVDYRKQLIIVLLLSVFAASVVYDTRFILQFDTLKTLVAAAIVAALGAIFLLARYPANLIQPAIWAAWPLHLFTICFLGVSWCFHGGSQLGSIIAYTIVAYATYLLVPLCLLLDRGLFDAFVKIVAVGSALLAIPCYVGALGIDNIAGFPLSNKYSYSQFSGIVASGGIFEHAEGHSLQMAIGMFCCFYAWRKSGKWLYAVCLAMTLAGLAVSQGRGALFGVMIAIAFCWLPELFRRSQPLFIGSLALCLVFPFLVWPQLSNIPGVASYLRMERGLSGRDVAWLYAIELVKEKPWTGYGFETAGELSEEGHKELRSSGYSGAGTTFHNTFVTKAVELGLVTTFFYSLMYVVSLARICIPTVHIFEQQLIRNVLVLSLTASIFRDYNVGGVRSTAILVAVFLGLANLLALVARFEQVPQDIDDSPATQVRTVPSAGQRMLNSSGQRGS